MTAPRAVLTAPAGGATVRGSITLRATAEDNLSGVVRVKWFLDQVQIATVGGGAPWERAWNSASVANDVHSWWQRHGTTPATGARRARS